MDTRHAPLSPFLETVRTLQAPGLGVIKVNGVAYAVQQLDGEAEGGERTVAGYRLTNTQSGKVYDVGRRGTSWHCDCPDSLYRPGRPGGCKHTIAIREVVAATNEERRVHVD